MKTKHIIRKIIFVTLTLAACAALSVLLVAAIGKKNKRLCKDYVVNIKPSQDNLSAASGCFITEKEIAKMMVSVNGTIKGEPVADFDLRKLEQMLKDNPWVQSANLYFDNRDVLHISVTEKRPIARIFTSTGKSFYIDSNMRQLPLSEKLSAKLPVFTSFPNKKSLSHKDSILLNDIKKTALFIVHDSFWMAQTEQIDITDERTFEMVPTIGSHIVKLGNGDDIEKKFHRLLIFYQQVMSKSGFDSYNYVDVQWRGQVVAAKEKMSKIDSVQLRRNVEKLLQEARQMQKDTSVMIPTAIIENISATTTNSDPVKRSTAKPKLIVEGRN